MAITTASAGEIERQGKNRTPLKRRLLRLDRALLFNWLEKNDYRGYDTFDGLSARFLRPFTFETKLLRIMLQQSVRRFS